jgi:hypothetical protein
VDEDLKALGGALCGVDSPSGLLVDFQPVNDWAKIRLRPLQIGPGRLVVVTAGISLRQSSYALNSFTLQRIFTPKVQDSSHATEQNQAGWIQILC